MEQYYFARVTSPWEYFTTPESRENDIDIGNIFRCEIIAVPTDAVPSKVKASFRPSRTFQTILGHPVLEYSKHLWNSLASESHYEVDPALFADPFLMLDAEEVEDLVCLYLQWRGWLVVPNTRKADKMSFEFELVRPNSQRHAKVQVKMGNTPLDLGHCEGMDHHVFLFQSNEVYVGSSMANVTALRREDLIQFVEENQSWLPRRFAQRMWLPAAA